MFKYLKFFIFLTVSGLTLISLQYRLLIVDYDTVELETFFTSEHSEKYCVIYNYWESGVEFSEGPHVTLVLHATSGYLPHLEEQLRTWAGGISVSVFIPTPANSSGYTVEVMESQLHLKAVFSSLSSPQAIKFKKSGQISLHLFFEKKYFQKCPKFVIPENTFSIFGASLADVKDFGDITEIYPINVARNIARKGSKTKLFVSGDIEQFYVQNFEPKIYQLAKKVLLEEKKKTVLVYRRFELNDSAPVPKTKKELKKLLLEKKAVQFHKKYYSIGHYIRHLKEWIEAPENDKIEIFEEIYYKNGEWEPQFVGDDRVPFHDERFPYRYRTNVQVGLHLCFMNFSFSVVSDLFSIHRGITRKEPPKVSYIKGLVRRKNPGSVRRAFRRELVETYPEMAKVCPY